jgi:LysM repeat protein
MRLQLRAAGAAFAVAIGVGAAAFAGTAGAAVPHTVQPGETLWSIAAANNLTTATVAAFNGVSEEHQVVVGETVQVPTVEEGAAALGSGGAAAGTTPTAPEPAPAGAGHTVIAGETLSSIAAANGISVDALAAANGRSADAYAYEGETLVVPAAGAGESTVSAPPPAADTAGLGHVPSPYGDLHLDPAAAESWNAMREQSLTAYGQDIHPAGGLSAYRTYEQQAQMYEAYLNGTGPMAAPPGTSAHELGTAVDLETPEMRWVIDQIGGAYGWGKTEAPGEWWHVNYAP